jgi:uncharacterized delta-60 repeat protein
MTPSRRALLLTVASLGLLASSVTAASATVRTVTRAPGRVVFPVDGGVISKNVDGGSAEAAVALPGGGALLAGDGYAAELNADGSPNPAFGDGGVARIAGGPPAFRVWQALRQDDGSFVLAGSGPALSGLQLPQVVLRRIRPDGTPDATFGTAGTAVLPIQSSCEGCNSVALLPDGRIVVTGNTGRQSPAIAHDPNAIPQTHWVVARLTPAGALDPSFGVAGIATLPPAAAGGYAVSALANGDLLSRGNARLATGRGGQLLVRLLPSGALDPTFNGGAPVPLVAGTGLAFGVLPNPDGTVVVDLGGALARYTPAGALDPTFGAGGIAQVGPNDLSQLLPAPAGAVIVVHQSDLAPGHQQVERVSATGAVDPTLGGPSGLSLTLGFGGGGSTFLVSQRPLPQPPLAQNTFRAGLYLVRADGSYLVVGGVHVSQATGEGAGFSIFDFAAAALTPAFAPDTSFGGPAIPLRAAVRVPAQTAATDRRRHGVRVTLDASAPGLARVVIKTHGRVIAQSVLPVFAAGRKTLPVELTAFGNQWLSRHHPVAVSVTATARDLLTATATATASGSLR